MSSSGSSGFRRGGRWPFSGSHSRRANSIARQRRRSFLEPLEQREPPGEMLLTLPALFGGSELWGDLGGSIDNADDQLKRPRPVSSASGSEDDRLRRPPDGIGSAEVVVPEGTHGASESFASGIWQPSPGGSWLGADFAFGDLAEPEPAPSLPLDTRSLDLGRGGGGGGGGGGSGESGGSGGGVPDGGGAAAASLAGNSGSANTSSGGAETGSPPPPGGSVDGQPQGNQPQSQPHAAPNAAPYPGRESPDPAQTGGPAGQARPDLPDAAHGDQRPAPPSPNPPARAHSATYPPSIPVLHTVHRLGATDKGQTFIQGAIDAQLPIGSEFRVNFYAAPVDVRSGDSALPDPFGSKLLVKRTAGLTGFSALFDTALPEDQTVFAKAEGPFENAPTFSDLVEVTLSKDDRGHGVGRITQQLAPNGGDGNRDGIPDHLQSDVASVPAADGQFLTLDARGQALRNVRVQQAPSPRAPHVDSPYGLISFELADVAPGGSATVTLFLPEDARADQAYKQDPVTGRLFPFDFDGTTGAVFRGNRVDLYLVDGGRGDADGLANGVIVDPLLLDSSGQHRTYVDVHGWSHFESGGSAAGRGSVNVVQGDLVLAEGDSFEVSASKRLVIPAGKDELQFEYRASFAGTTSRRINDAFEVALLDDRGNSLVPTIRVDRDSFFNLTENLAANHGTSGSFAELGVLTQHAAVAAGGASAAGVVTLNVSGLADGLTPRNLVVRLVNNDADTGTTVTILGNRAPVANDDGLDISGQPDPAFTVSEDEVLTLDIAGDLLVNDVDADGDPLTLHRTLPTPTGLRRGANPLHGTLTLGGDGTNLVYTPDENFYGVDTFQYWAFDGLKYSDVPATVTITVTRDDTDAPIAVDDYYTLNVSGQPAISGNVLGNDIDVDRLYDDPPLSTLTASVVENDSEFPRPDGLSFSADGSFTYTPPTGTEGDVTFKYVAIDAEDDRDEAIVTITVIVPPSSNTPPSIDGVQLAPANKLEGSLVTLSGTASDADAGDTLTVEVDWQDGSPMEVAAVTNGSFSLEHVYADNGTYAVLVDAKDNHGAYAPRETIDAVIANVAPALTAGLAFQVTDGNGNQKQMEAVVSGAFTDPGFTWWNTVEEFQVTVDWGDGSADAFQHQQLNVRQGGMDSGQLRRTSGNFTASHQYADTGPYTITVTVYDDDGGSDAVTLVTGYMEEIWIESAITPSQQGRIPVRIGPGSSVDVSLIDVDSLRFGPAGAKVVEYQLIPAQNPNKLHLKFNAQDAGIAPPANGKNEMRSLFVTGSLYDGTAYVGMDTVHINAGPAGTAAGGGSSNPAGGEVPKFFVADAGRERLYRYTPSGAPYDSVALAGKPREPRGLTIFDYNDPHDLSDAVLWSIDKDGRVTAQTIEGRELASWRADKLSAPQGITTDGTDIWIVDADHDKVYRYAGMARAGSQVQVARPTDSFSLAAANVSATGLTTDGSLFWVVDDAADRVFVYDRSGGLEGSWPLDSLNADPSGITGSLLQELNGDDVSQTLWIVDRQDLVVYKYAGGKNWRNDQQAHGAKPNPFALVSQNDRPEGIADPQGNNQHPVAQDDFHYLVQASVPIKIYALNNDYDTDGDRLVISSVGTPSAGSAQISAAGDYITYTPGSGFSGDSFQYTASDGYGGAVNATVWLDGGAFGYGGYGGALASDDTFYLYHVPDGAAVDIYPLNNDLGDLPLQITSVGTAASGTVQISANGLYVTYTPTAGHVNDSFTYTFQDGYSGSDSATVWLDEGMCGGYGSYGGYGGSPPVANDDHVYNVTPGIAVNIYVMDNDWDPDSDPLTIISVSSAAAGTVQIAPGGGYVTYTPGSGFTSDSFTYTISDGNGNTDTATVYLQDDSYGGYGGSPPIANDDYVYNVTQGIPVDVYALDNDWDPDSDPLTIISTSFPAWGAVEIAVDGSYVTYTAGAGFTSDSFTYTISDGNGNTDTATVYLTDDSYGGYGGSPPVAVDDFIWNVSGGIPLNIYVLDNDYDADGDPLTIASISSPAQGTVAIRNGYVTYTPSAGFTGDRFDYTIDDGKGNTAGATVYLHSDSAYGGYGGDTGSTGGDGDWGYGGDGPLAVDDFLIGALPGVPNAVYVLDNDGHYRGSPIAITAVGPAAHGTVQIAPAGDHLLYTPGAAASRDRFTYTISDGAGQTATATVRVESWRYDWQYDDPAYYRWYFSRTGDSGVSADSPAFDLARAMAAEPALVIGAEFVALPPIARSYAIVSEPIGLFQNHSASGAYAVLSTGEAALVNDPDAAASFDLKGGNVRGDSDYDVTILKIDLNVPAGANYLSFDFQFLSQEFPLLFEEYNDAFIAELDSSTWTVSGGTISAPDNFAVFGGGSAVGVLEIA